MYESACRELRHGKVERIFFLVGGRASTVTAYHAGAHPASDCRPVRSCKSSARRALSDVLVAAGKVLVTTAA